ncbi:helix-turn-helix domain-containing protein [Clostridium pasteurianum]|uniref:SOS response transcriptional repressor, RecA-mediated autopeptidase n=1 Tax=Clostridium pasteurianum BC1 TaxID=86416 RepID=R4K4Z8_CLOPA|nr:XRE family transcriptional regulator [Clostridium pasteurianum]AGK95599.1 SOS response transcriptional repressor, RecA-mediated autopeptidase [Clostridium pasteurianum BC1]
MDIGNNIKMIRKEKGFTQKELALKAHLSRSYLADLENSRYNPSIDTLESISNALQTPLTYLMGESAKAIIDNKLADLNMTVEELSEKSGVPKLFFENLDNIQPEEQDYNHMNTIGRIINVQPRILCSALSKQEPPSYEGPRISAKEAFGDSPWINEDKIKESAAIYDTLNKDLSNIVNIPIVGVVRAGRPILAQDNVEGYLPTLKQFIDNDKDYFYLRVKGDSMDQEFKDGSLLLIEKTPCIENGQIGAVLIDSMEATVKKVVKNDNMITLIPMSNNSKYLPKMYDIQKDDIHIIGVVKQAVKIY